MSFLKNRNCNNIANFVFNITPIKKIRSYPLYAVKNMQKKEALKRVTRFELVQTVWKTGNLPLIYTRVTIK